MDTNKAGWDDNLKPSLVEEKKDILADNIAYLIKLSFENGDVPDKLKLAKVIPILKKKYNISDEYQFGFRKDHFTTLAKMEVHENIINTLEKGSYIAGLYLDLSRHLIL